MGKSAAPQTLRKPTPEESESIKQWCRACYQKQLRTSRTFNIIWATITVSTLICGIAKPDVGIEIIGGVFLIFAVCNYCTGRKMRRTAVRICTDMIPFSVCDGTISRVEATEQAGDSLYAYFHAASESRDGTEYGSYLIQNRSVDVGLKVIYVKFDDDSLPSAILTQYMLSRKGLEEKLFS